MKKRSGSIEQWQVPSVVRPLIERALREADLRLASAAACEALRTVRFPLAKNQEIRVCLPDALDDAQKAVALALSAREELAIDRFAIPFGTDIVRRWLGVDPPTLLEATVTHVDSGARRTEPRWARYLRQLNPRLDDVTPQDSIEALEATIALLDRAYGIHPDPNFAAPIIRAVGARGLPAAKRHLERLSRALEATNDERQRDEVTRDKSFIQHAFVAANAPFDPRILPFLTLAKCNDEEKLALIRWLPEDRRDEVVLAMLRADPIWRMRTGAKILCEFALPRTAAYIADEHRKDKPDSQSPASAKKATGALLEKAAKKHRTIAAALAPALSPAARKSLGVKYARSEEPDESSAPRWKPLPAKASVPARVGNYVDGVTAGGLHGPDASALRKEGKALIDEVFRKSPSMCRRPASLSAMERALIVAFLSQTWWPNLLAAGLWDEQHEIERALGLSPPSIQDIELDVDGDRAPAWCFVREHLHRNSPTLDALERAVAKLDDPQRFELFASFLAQHGTSSSGYPFWTAVEGDDGGPRRNEPPPHRARLCRLVAALAIALGERAEHLVTEHAYDAEELEYPPSLHGSLALAALSALAHSRGHELDARWNAARAIVTELDDVKTDPALLAAILDQPEPVESKPAATKKSTSKSKK